MKKIIFAFSIITLALMIITGAGENNRLQAHDDKQNTTASCTGIGIVTHSTENSLYLLNPLTHSLDGPYLNGQLGTGKHTLHTAVSPLGNTVVITNPDSETVFVVQLPDRWGQPPTLKGTINIGFNAHDIVISPDGLLAFIHYHGAQPFIATVDIKNGLLLNTYRLPPLMTVSQLDIAADGRTLLATDTDNSTIHVLLLDEEGYLSKTDSIALNFQPRDVAISPDGLTAIVVNPEIGSPAALRIDSPGKVVSVETQIPLRYSYGVSALFSPDGSRIYYLSNSPIQSRLHILNLSSPGIISPSLNPISFDNNAIGENLPTSFEELVSGSGGRYVYALKKGIDTDPAHSMTLIDLESQQRVNNLAGIDFPFNIVFACTHPSISRPTAADQKPFGSFDTPINGATVRSSVAVTGWALDDQGIENVKLYRAQGSALVYIGDASFVEGARPDVALAYPGYPNNTRAGWGYMLLTNFFPNGGNGTFKLHAIAKDTGGQQITLGVKTITIDNANATKPFGAIDTPLQGQTISGSNYRIQGWALTPLPNNIPTDGSTIDVKINGLSIGSPTYNIYRSDIADLFPGYANSNGSLAYIDIDTTQFSDGIHTLEWTVKDSANNIDGVGSRYFRINNAAATNGIIIGYINSAATGDPISQAEVSIYNGTTLVDVISSDSNGRYTTELAVGITYNLRVNRSGYLECPYNNITIDSENVLYLETVLQVPTQNSGRGTVSGTIIDALDGSGVYNASIQVRIGINTFVGTVISSTYTNYNGYYSISVLTGGNYTVEISINGYHTTYYSIICLGGLTIDNQNNTISTEIPTGQIRAVLTWGATPSDLDSHMTGPTSGGSRFHVYWRSQGYATYSPFCALDLDDVTSYGPETITIYQQLSGTYRYSVHNYSDGGSSTSSRLSASNAKIVVYGSTGTLATFNVPTNRTGTLWTVFEISGNQITPVNTIGSESSFSSLDSNQPPGAIAPKANDMHLIRNLPKKK
jgi:Carboxypeptidase regulatory-like domain/WD40-like Beta Propeller Repeat